MTQSVMYSSRPWRVMPAVAAFPGHDGGDAFVPQPVEEPAQLRAQHARLGQSGKERFDGVEDDPLGADGVDRVPQADEQTVQVVLAGLLDLVGLDPDVVQRELLARRERARVEPERREIQRQIFDRFLERQEHAGFAVLARPIASRIPSRESSCRTRDLRRRASAGPAASRHR